MSSSPPFIDRESGALETSQIWAEAFPLIGLIVLFGALAMIPFLAVIMFAGNSFLGAMLTVLSQFILAVGSGIVLIYVIARGNQLAGT